MSWHAVDAVDDAVDATRRFLFPFSLVRWTKLAFLVLLMGGSGGASVNASFSAVSDVATMVPQGSSPELMGAGPEAVDLGDLVATSDPALLVAIAAGIVFVLAAITVISLSLRLVFYDALRTNVVRIWQPFRSRLRQSVGLFLFTAAFGIASAAPIALAVVVAIAANEPIGWEPVDTLAGTIGSLAIGPTVVLGLVGAALVAVLALVLRFTYEFVIPTMIVEETGTIGGWRRFWPTLRTEWTEFMLYLVVHFVVSIGLSVVEGIAAIIGFALVATVAGLVLLIVAVALGGVGAMIGTTAGTAAIVLVFVAALVILVALLLPVRVVTRSYRIAYETATLGRIDPALALLHRDLGPGLSITSESENADSIDITNSTDPTESTDPTDR